MANSFRNDTYRSAKNLSYITIGLLGSLIACAILFIIFSFGAILYPDLLFDLGDGEMMPAAYALIGLVALLQIPLSIATIVFFLIWQYRAVSNLSALKARNLEFSPGWAVGWWFVPFANLVKPFQAMRELWNESDPDYDADLGFLSGSVGAPMIMGFWWAFWLLSNFSDRIANKMDDSPYFPTAMIVASILEIIAGSLLIKIILYITKRQDLRFQRLEMSQPLVPPPPSFGENLQAGFSGNFQQ